MSHLLGSIYPYFYKTCKDIYIYIYIKNNLHVFNYNSLTPKMHVKRVYSTDFTKRIIKATCRLSSSLRPRIKTVHRCTSCTRNVFPYIYIYIKNSSHVFNYNSFKQKIHVKRVYSTDFTKRIIKATCRLSSSLRPRIRTVHRCTSRT